MRTSITPNATPHSNPPSSAGSRGEVDPWAKDGHYIWTSLVPRLVHPTKLAIVEALVEVGTPQSVDDLSPKLLEVDRNPGAIRYHARYMVEAGTLELTSTQIKDGEEAPLLYFPSSE